LNVETSARLPILAARLARARETAMSVLLEAGLLLKVRFADPASGVESRASVRGSDTRSAEIEVGRTLELRVSLVYIPADCGVSQQAGGRTTWPEGVDVLVVCPGARVCPRRGRLLLPPDAERFAKFTVTPLERGVSSLTVMLLIANEPVHSGEFAVVVGESYQTTGYATPELQAVPS
jgi:hypothetical protein